jgi:hypothetical protein
MPSSTLISSTAAYKNGVIRPQDIPNFIPACSISGTICFDFQQRQQFFFAATSRPALETKHANFHPFSTEVPLSTCKRAVADRFLPSCAKV